MRRIAGRRKMRFELLPAMRAKEEVIMSDDFQRERISCNLIKDQGGEERVISVVFAQRRGV